MKKILIFAIFICIAFPVFSQNANRDRFKALSDSMGRTISSTTSKLENYDEMTAENGETKTFTYYNRRHEAIKQALNDSERRLDLLIRTNDRHALVMEERNNYESLLKRLEDVKSEYDNWLKSLK